ncbi:hypothetical protein [Legionella maioricensis]|nr:hypothetical protein [Legionella maioricensis]
MNKNSVVLPLSASLLTGSTHTGTMRPVLALNHSYNFLFNLTYIA